MSCCFPVVSHGVQLPAAFNARRRWNATFGHLGDGPHETELQHSSLLTPPLAQQQLRVVQQPTRAHRATTHSVSQPAGHRPLDSSPAL